MQKYIAQRVLLMIPTLLMISLLTFVFLRVFLPESTTDRILIEYGRNDDELRDAINEQLGLDGSKVEQYLEWMGVTWFWGGEKGLLQGDLGRGLQSRRPILQEVKRRVPVSFELGLWGQFAALMVSVPLGVYAAVRQDRWPDYGLRSFAILLAAVPGFWIAILALTFGSIWFNWAPPIHFKSLTADPVAHFQIMLAPALIIGLTPSGGLLRLVRTQMLEVMRQDYVRTARSKGLSESTVLYKHALRNALIPVVTVVGTSLPNIIAGTIIFEQIFVLPGMGQYLLLAIDQLDYPVIMSLTMVFAALLLVAVVIVDISYALLDPRIRFD
jgi:peptide/nickel transport system permease protein